MRTATALAALLLLSAAANAQVSTAPKPPSPGLETRTYNLDPHHTNIIWHVNHFGFSNPSGRFGIVKGNILWNDLKPEQTTLDVTIDVAGLATGMDDFNTHIKSADFLDAAKYPTATFTSTKVLPMGHDAAKVTGNLTLHGVTVPVTLEVKLNKTGINPVSQKQTVGFSAKGTLKRSDFGISKYVPDVSDEVTLDIEAEANY